MQVFGTISKEQAKRKKKKKEEKAANNRLHQCPKSN